MIKAVYKSICKECDDIIYYTGKNAYDCNTCKKRKFGEVEILKLNCGIFHNKAIVRTSKGDIKLVKISKLRIIIEV